MYVFFSLNASFKKQKDRPQWLTMSGSEHSGIKSRFALNSILNVKTDECAVALDTV